MLGNVLKECSVKYEGKQSNSNGASLKKVGFLDKNMNVKCIIQAQQFEDPVYA